MYPKLFDLQARALKNGVETKLIDIDKTKHLVNDINQIGKKALWSPHTSIVNPSEIIDTLHKELKEKGAKFKFNLPPIISISNRKLNLEDGSKIEFDYLYNCSGANADKLAHMMKIGVEYRIFPFRGNYWELKTNRFDIKTNIYPIPDLRYPFLGIHFTPDAIYPNKIYIGPTAELALGRQNYRGYEGIEFNDFIKNVSALSTDYILDRGRFRGYFHDQAFQGLFPILVKAAKSIIPSIRAEDIKKSDKVGIRSQLYNLKEHKLVEDFLCINGINSCHVINAVSPAFTASFELADLIINKSSISF